jgi:hypothetical protein
MPQDKSMNKTTYNKVFKQCQDGGMTNDQAHELATEKQEQADNRNRARKERDQAMRDCGLVKVRGALGGVYWE